MEDDFFEVSPAEDAELTRLGITYEWRDSCLPLMKSFLLCKEANYWPVWMVRCWSSRKDWENCQQARETRIIKTVDLQRVKSPAKAE